VRAWAGRRQANETIRTHGRIDECTIMRAIIYTEFGGPSVLQIAEVEEPRVGAGQVRLRVAAAGVNPFDAKVRSGAMQGVMPTTFPAIPGIDVAGTVDEVGAGVTGFAVGDEVLGWAQRGSYAEYALATDVAHKPATLSWTQAAALPVAGETAMRGLNLLGVRAGETLLINGAAGGVGTMAVQVAVLRGATVLGTSGPANQEYLRSLGAIPVAYGVGLVERVRALAPQGIDAVFDVAGKGALPDAIALRGGTDRIITIADPNAGALGIPFSSSATREQRLAALALLIPEVAEGRITIEATQTFRLEQAARAHEALERGHGRGRIVLTV
jgi:NADPH:quinone reductase-like Zn-dependent oxidoreductase